MIGPGRVRASSLLRAMLCRSRVLHCGQAAAGLTLLAMAVSPSVAVGIPNPGLGSSLLTGISCASPISCWAVGSYGNDQGAQVNEALGWDGTKWSLAATPNPGAQASSQAATSPKGSRARPQANASPSACTTRASALRRWGSTRCCAGTGRSGRSDPRPTPAATVGSTRSSALRAQRPANASPSGPTGKASGLPPALMARSCAGTGRHGRARARRTSALHMRS